MRSIHPANSPLGRLLASKAASAVVGVALAAVLLGGVLAPASANATQLRTDWVGDASAGSRSVPLAALPDMTAQAGVLVTADGRVLWARHPDERRAMASITKIMTGVIAIENAKASELITIPVDSTTVGESTSYLVAGERLPLKTVLEGLLVKSGNDAAIAIAENVAPDRTQATFVKMMNQKAVDLGLKNTHFENPHGLDAPGHYTSAADLAVLARYAMTKPLFREIVGMKEAQIGPDKVMSTNLMLGNYTGANGIKTGFTDKAGYCVATSAVRDGLELYAIVLDTPSELQRFRDARELLDWGFAHYRRQKLASKGTVVAEAPVSDFLDVTAPAKIAQDAYVTALDFDGPITRTVTVSEVKAPVAKGQKLGVATFTQHGKVIASVSIVATKDIGAPNIFARAGIGVVRVWRRIFGGQLMAPPVTSAFVPALAGGVSY